MYINDVHLVYFYFTFFLYIKNVHSKCCYLWYFIYIHLVSTSLMYIDDVHLMYFYFTFFLYINNVHSKCTFKMYYMISHFFGTFLKCIFIHFYFTFFLYILDVEFFSPDKSVRTRRDVITIHREFVTQRFWIPFFIFQSIAILIKQTFAKITIVIIINVLICQRSRYRLLYCT